MMRTLNLAPGAADVESRNIRRIALPEPRLGRIEAARAHPSARVALDTRPRGRDVDGNRVGRRGQKALGHGSCPTAPADGHAYQNRYLRKYFIPDASLTRTLCRPSPPLPTRPQGPLYRPECEAFKIALQNQGFKWFPEAVAWVRPDGVEPDIIRRAVEACLEEGHYFSDDDLLDLRHQLRDAHGTGNRIADPRCSETHISNFLKANSQNLSNERRGHRVDRSSTLDALSRYHFADRVRLSVGDGEFEAVGPASYHHKEFLKTLGFKYRGDPHKVWYLNHHNARSMRLTCSDAIRQLRAEARIRGFLVWGGVTERGWTLAMDHARTMDIIGEAVERGRHRSVSAAAPRRGGSATAAPRPDGDPYSTPPRRSAGERGGDSQDMVVAVVTPEEAERDRFDRARRAGDYFDLTAEQEASSRGTGTGAKRIRGAGPAESSAAGSRVERRGGGGQESVSGVTLSYGAAVSSGAKRAKRSDATPVKTENQGARGGGRGRARRGGTTR